MTSHWGEERTEINATFAEMIKRPTADGSKKRQAGEKPSWKIDPSHEAALFSHLNRWKHGEQVDPESGAHPLVHLAWRALAIAWQETQERTAKDTALAISVGLRDLKDPRRVDNEFLAEQGRRCPKIGEWCKRPSCAAIFSCALTTDSMNSVQLTAIDNEFLDRTLYWCPSTGDECSSDCTNECKDGYTCPVCSGLHPIDEHF